MIDFTKKTEQEREMSLGRMFREIYVIKSDGFSKTLCIIEGNPIMLIGFPEDALKAYLGGRTNGEISS